MRIESIRLTNFKVFKKLSLHNIPDVALFIGANGTGKSTLFDVFGFLSDALTNNVKQALAVRGGFKEVISRGCSTSDFITIEITLLVRIHKEKRNLTYRLEIKNEKDNEITVHEKLIYTPMNGTGPKTLFQCKNGKGWAINEERFYKKDEELTKEQQKLSDPSILAIKGLGQFERFKAATAFRNFIEKWHLSDFHISEARVSQDAGYAEHLSPAGENLPLVAQYMFENHHDTFTQVLEKMKSRVPGVADVKAETTVDGRIVLQFKEGEFTDPFLAKHVSDGTIKMFAYLILLYDPNPHPLFCIEEPENQLYPSLFNELLEEFRLYSKRKSGSQVFITSHSPDLLDAAQYEEVYWLVKEKGFTSIKRASDDEKLRAHIDAGDTLGNLWKQNYMDGAHPRVDPK